ncbi:MAG: PDZ domain-containing protein [Sedimentisphaerales bacterium]|nr:PDZ domain-containing protein [Sedimentisphaerales bacterium]
MNRRTILLGCIALLVGGVPSYAGGQRGYIGVQLAPEPLPEILVKHLRLNAGQGVRISNVTVGSAADKAGLERDDIITAFQGQDITSSSRLVEAVRGLDADTEVSLEIIHLGGRKTVKFALEPLPAEGKLKYPPEPKSVTSWRPGKVFKIGPESQEWMEVPFDQVPEVNFDVKQFFKELYTYHHSTDGADFTVTIEGDPEAEDSRVIVRSGDTEHSTTVGKLDALPEEYRRPAEEALANARESSKGRVEIRQFHLPAPPAPNVWRKHFEDIRVPRPDLERWSEKKDQAFEKLQEQMERLQKRMEELEERNRETLDRLLEKKEKSGESTEKTQGDRAVRPPSRQSV